MSHQGPQLDILSGNFKKVDEKFILKFSKDSCQDISTEAKINCKILKFTSGWKLDDVLLTLSDLSLDEYPNLFIFIINNYNFEFYKGNFVQKKLTRNKLLEKIRKSLTKFENRPLILQLALTYKI